MNGFTTDHDDTSEDNEASAFDHSSDAESQPSSSWWDKLFGRKEDEKSPDEQVDEARERVARFRERADEDADIDDASGGSKFGNALAEAIAIHLHSLDQHIYCHDEALDGYRSNDLDYGEGTWGQKVLCLHAGLDEAEETLELIRSKAREFADREDLGQILPSQRDWRRALQAMEDSAIIRLQLARHGIAYRLVREVSDLAAKLADHPDEDQVAAIQQRLRNIFVDMPRHWAFGILDLAMVDGLIDQSVADLVPQFFRSY